jgi:ubiquinone/menaquinone biosynthesis C-methylase UbiE/DNA-binding transcriptional ArsR family regulator
MSNFLQALKLLAEPTRLRMLLLLAEEELTVAELQEILGMGQSRISTHLAQLRGAALVGDRRLGKFSYYQPGPAAAQPLVRTLLAEAAAALPEVSTDRTALQLCLRKRTDRATEYFNQLAGKFGRTYIPGRSWRGLAHALLRLLPPMRVADLGAGEGTLSMLLARQARHVIAVDYSEKMVEFGSRLARENGLPNLEYRLGDIEAPPLADGEVELAVFSQALHHVPRPAVALREAFRILQPGGRVLILDLAAHSFEQARELYRHQWLGFSEVHLHEMLEKAGFVEIEISIVATEKNPPHFRTLLATAHRPGT